MADGGAATDGQAKRGPFRRGEAVACPDCGATNWLVDRRSAECASCSAALPLAGGEPLGASGARLRKGAKGFRPVGNG
jgi:hypothetical protein